MTKPELSIIIPCYNCERTLEEAVNSCFIQGLTSFEIIMVDDGSTDKTREVMKDLAEKHSEIKLFYHEKNQGGGATRNTAVKNSGADIIFCLDSDDMLTPNTLSKMLMFFQEKIKSNKPCDGIGIHRSIKFKGTDPTNVARIDTFGYAGDVIPFESLVEGPGKPLCSLYSTFLFTRKAFEITGGYPENHGFDTQAFAWRFLAHGLTAYTCPNAEYLHRIHFTKSYYIREYESGKINHNWFKIYEEFLYIFNNDIKRSILQFNLNTTTTSLSGIISDVQNPFCFGYQDYIRPNGEKLYEKRLKEKNDISTEDLYWLAFKKYQENDYLIALNLFERTVAKGLHNGYVQWYIKECCKTTNKTSPFFNQVLLNETFNLNKQGSQINIIIRVYRKIIKLFKKIKVTQFVNLYQTTEHKN